MQIATHFGADFEGHLRAAVARALDQDDDALAGPWTELDTAVSGWLEMYGSRTSLVTQRLDVLDKLAELFPGKNLHADPGITETILGRHRSRRCW